MEWSAGLRPAAARSAERTQEIPWIFRLLNVLRPTEPRSAVAEIDLGNTSSRCARWRDERGFAVDVSSVLCILICAETMKATMDTKNRFFCAKSSPLLSRRSGPGKRFF